MIWADYIENTTTASVVKDAVLTSSNGCAVETGLDIVVSLVFDTAVPKDTKIYFDLKYKKNETDSTFQTYAELEGQQAIHHVFVVKTSRDEIDGTAGKNYIIGDGKQKKFVLNIHNEYGALVQLYVEDVKGAVVTGNCSAYVMHVMK